MIALDPHKANVVIDNRDNMHPHYYVVNYEVTQAAFHTMVRDGHVNVLFSHDRS